MCFKTRKSALEAKLKTNCELFKLSIKIILRQTRRFKQMSAQDELFKKV